jgi:hypothetical protein
MGRTGHFLLFGAAIATSAVAVYALSGDAHGGGVSTRSPEGKIDPGAAALRAELNAVHGTVRQLAQTQADLQRELDRSAAERPVADSARDDAAPAARVGLDDPAAADRAASALASRCDETLSGQQIDTAWSRTKTEQFGAFFARPPLAGTKMKAVDCRTTMCRIELSHRSREDRASFIQHISDLAGPTGVVFAHIEKDDDLDIVVYVTRDGVGLP